MKRYSGASVPSRASQITLFVLARLLVSALVVFALTLADRAEAQTARVLAEPTALDQYVAAPDTNFNFRLLDTTPTPLGTVHLLEMTSQSWLTTNEVDRPLWQHWLHVLVPNGASGHTALLLIGGGGNKKRPPGGPDANLARIAVETKSVAVELRNVPNQPLVFHQDGKKRNEDDLIAYTWNQFLRTGDERWPARLPMTKSAVRAMDAVTAFCAIFSSPPGLRKHSCSRASPP